MDFERDTIQPMAIPDVSLEECDKEKHQIMKQMICSAICTCAIVTEGEGLRNGVATGSPENDMTQMHRGGEGRPLGQVLRRPSSGPHTEPREITKEGFLIENIWSLILKELKIVHFLEDGGHHLGEES